MQAKYVDVLKTPGGNYKVYAWGSADGHYSDWNGCNYRRVPVPGQPHQGWPDPVQAFRFLRNLDKDEVLREASRKAGSFMSDNDGYTHVDTSDLTHAQLLRVNGEFAPWTGPKPQRPQPPEERKVTVLTRTAHKVTRYTLSYTEAQRFVAELERMPDSMTDEVLVVSEMDPRRVAENLDILTRWTRA